MLKLRSISKKEFDNFIKEQNNTHYMHSSAWGEFEKVTNNVSTHYLGLVNEDNDILAATILLEEHLPLNCSNLTAPHGFIVDYENKRLVKIFNNKIKKFAKIKKATSIKINPSIPITNDFKSLLKDMGYKKDITTDIEYTYSLILDKTLKEIEKNYSESTKKELEETEKYDLELVLGNQKDLNELFLLNNNQNKNYYETLYDIFSNSEHTKIKLFLGKLHITKTIKILEKEIIRTNNQIAIIPIDNLDSSSKERLTSLRSKKEFLSKSLKEFKEYKLKYGNSLTISASLIMEQKNNAWILEEFKHDIIKETTLANNIYNEYIKYYKNNSFTKINQISKESKGFGDDITEYTEKYILIVNKITYIIQNKVLPFFNKIKQNKKESE